MNAKKEFEKFRSTNTHFLSQKLDERKDEYYKHSRCNKLSELYARIIENNTECTDATHIYVPRKFRKDEYNIMSEAELIAISKFEQERLKSECEILQLRRDEFLNRTSKIDTDVKNFIQSKSLSDSTETMAINRWDKCVSQDCEKVDSEWHKKIESTKESFTRDKEIYMKHQKTRVKYQNKSALDHQEPQQNENSFYHNDCQEDSSFLTSSNYPTRSSTSRDDDQSKNVNGSRQRFHLRLRSHQR